MPEPVHRAVLLFGAPGVGKGTQGQRLGRLPHFVHLSTGDMFRSLDKNGPIGKEVRTYTERGVLVPDDLTIRIFRETVQGLVTSHLFDPARDTLVLDGIPRNVNQARILEDDLRIVRLIYFGASDEDAMVARVKKRALIEGRKDDADETIIRRRFEIYRRESSPVLDYYSPDLILEIDALGTPEEVSATIERGLLNT
jgi:adenylate kinase